MNEYLLLTYGLTGLVWMIVKIIAGLLTSISIVSYFGLTGIYWTGAVIVVWMIICRLIITDKFLNSYSEKVEEYTKENEL